MCDLCIEIKNPQEKTLQKVEIAGEILAKTVSARKLKSRRREVSPYRALRELEIESKMVVERLLLDLFHEITRKWLHIEKAAGVFQLQGQIYINPKTGKPLTAKQWTTMKAQLAKAFGIIYKPQEKELVRRAMALGYLLRGMPADAVISVGLKGVNLNANLVTQILSGPQFQDTLTFARQHVAENVTRVTQQGAKQIHDTILTSMKNRDSTRELERKLFDDFSTQNRDWRRVAETEIAESANNGQLIYDLQTAPEDAPIFERGLSSSGACPWCQSMVDGQLFVLQDKAPVGAGDKITIKGETYTVIWPGKNNVGRAKRDWWVAAGVQHPHCRCSFVREVPGFKKVVDKFRAAMEVEMVRVEKMEGSHQQYTSTEYLNALKKYGVLPEKGVK